MFKVRGQNRIACVRAAAIFALLFSATGCATMTPGKLDRVQPTSDEARVGNVYLLRGWIGIFSEGMNSLGQTLNRSGVRTTVYQDDQWDQLAQTIRKRYAKADRREPLVLIGHSFGADDVLRMSRELRLAGIPVDLVITLDPVTPPQVPSNVRLCFNLYQSNGAWDTVPMFRGIPLKQEAGSPGQLKNIDVRKDRVDLLEPGTNHFNIEKNGKIHAEVLKQVLTACPARPRESVTQNWTSGSPN